jgi:hypothetical protein
MYKALDIAIIILRGFYSIKITTLEKKKSLKLVTSASILRS